MTKAAKNLEELKGLEPIVAGTEDAPVKNELSKPVQNAILTVLNGAMQQRGEITFRDMAHCINICGMTNIEMIGLVQLMYRHSVAMTFKLRQDAGKSVDERTLGMIENGVFSELLKYREEMMGARRTSMITVGLGPDGQPKDIIETLLADD